MDKLEPVLKYKFWILLVIGLSLTTAGWWMATSQLAKDTTDRTAAVDSSFKSIPGGEIPNESWAKRLGAINTDQSNAIQSTKMSMWKRQRDRMTWPEGISDPGYHGKFTNSDRELYRDSYQDLVRRVWKMVNPMNKNDGTGIVEYPLNQVHTLLKQRSWDVAPPDSEVMWSVQEDLWLLEGLFQTIVAINGGYEGTRVDAVIHQIDKLELRGGGDKVRDTGGPAAGAGPAGPGMEMGFPGGMKPPGGGSIVEGLKMVSAEFDPAEEFGDDGSRAAGQAMMGSPMAMGSAGGFGGGPAAAAAPTVALKRYLVTDASLPFKKRGFYLSVKMDHTKIPLLIAELTANEKSVWPIEVLRVQMSRLNEDDNAIGKPIRGPAGPASPMSPPVMSSPSSFSSPMSSPSSGSSLGSSPFNPDPEPASVSNPFGGEFPGNMRPGGFNQDVNNTLIAQQMRVALENTLKDPTMAQVTICGAITLFNEVVEEKKPAAAAPATTVPAPEDMESEKSEKPETPSADAPTAESTAEADAEKMEPAEADAEMTEKAEGAPKADAPAKNDSDEKPDPAPKPQPAEKPEPSDKPEPADKPDPGDSKPEVKEK